MSKKVRVPIPQDMAARVLFESDRTCCVCVGKKPVQIHHIDDDPSHNSLENFAVLCFDCHRDTQISGGFDRKLDAEQVRLYRDHWLEAVRRNRMSGRQEATVVGKTDRDTLRLRLARLEIAREQEDWLQVARIYAGAGDIELRDQYLKRANDVADSAHQRMVIARIAGTESELSDEVFDEAAREVAGDWTSYGSVLMTAGRTKQALLAWLAGITESVEQDRWFTAAYYIKHSLLEKAWEPMLLEALRISTEAGDIWWQLRCYEELGWDKEVKNLLLQEEEAVRADGRLTLMLKLASAQGDRDEVLRLTKEIARLGAAAHYTVISPATNRATDTSEDVK